MKINENYPAVDEKTTQKRDLFDALFKAIPYYHDDCDHFS